MSCTCALISRDNSLHLDYCAMGYFFLVCFFLLLSHSTCTPRRRVAQAHRPLLFVHKQTHSVQMLEKTKTKNGFPFAGRTVFSGLFFICRRKIIVVFSSVHFISAIPCAVDYKWPSRSLVIRHTDTLLHWWTTNIKTK